jgi:hypothetical protein
MCTSPNRIDVRPRFEDPGLHPLIRVWIRGIHRIDDRKSMLFDLRTINRQPEFGRNMLT